MGNFAPPFQRILVVDDDPGLLKLLHYVLAREGFEVLTALSGKEALGLIEHYGLPHLAIVDLNMPEMTGFEFCKQVQAYSDLPVIILTAVSEQATVIRGIEQFAEDFMIKPLRPRELVARVRRVLLRIGDFSYALAPLTKVDDRLMVDFARQQVLVEGKAVALTPTETKILHILLCNRSRTVTTDFLLRRLWPLEEVLEDTLRVHIHHLRKKIQDPASPLQYIVTERGVGYRFMP